MKTIPCHQCITLAMCIEKGSHTNGVTNLAHKCSLLSDWLTGEEGGWDIRLIYEGYCFFERGEVKEIDPASL